jgi:environmental stress-induced protein Ves
MTQHRVLSPADYRRMPWKNGGGRTTEIVSHPPRASLDAFDWRVSVADIGRDGPFSVFAGIDRTIVMIAGGGMRLDGDGHAAVLSAAYEPYTFSGDDAIHCALLDGPVRDFNLMLRRGRATGSLAIVRGAGTRIGPARFRLCYAAAGACECLFAGHPPQVVAADHALLVEDLPASAALLAVNPLTGDAVVVAVSIDLAP